MIIERLGLDGICLIRNKCFSDDRGFFTERLRDDEWKKHFPDSPAFVQENYSWSKPGVLRGLHFQTDPGQSKLVTCVSGSVLDVVVDIRQKSPTFGQHLRIDLSADEPEWLWVPEGFAHGFIVTSDSGAGVLYKVTNYYNASGERSILWNDADLNIAWPSKSPILSEKDRRAPTFRAYAED